MQTALDTTEKLDASFVHEDTSAKLRPPRKPHTVLYVVIFFVAVLSLTTASVYAYWVIALVPQQQDALHKNFVAGYNSGNVAGKNFQQAKDQQVAQQNLSSWQKQEKVDIANAVTTAVAQEKISATQQGRQAMYSSALVWLQNNCRKVQGTSLYLCNNYNGIPQP